MFQTQQKYSNSSQLGEQWEVAENVSKGIEAFTCITCGYSQETSVNVVRSKILQKMFGEDNDLHKESKVDFSHLPPCQGSLFPHIYNVNHRIVTYKRAHSPYIGKDKA